MEGVDCGQASGGTTWLAMARLRHRRTPSSVSHSLVAARRRPSSACRWTSAPEQPIGAPSSLAAFSQDAGVGDVQHSAGKDYSDRSLSGLVQDVIRGAAVVKAPKPLTAITDGAAKPGRSRNSSWTSVISAVRHWHLRAARRKACSTCGLRQVCVQAWPEEGFLVRSGLTCRRLGVLGREVGDGPGLLT